MDKSYFIYRLKAKQKIKEKINKIKHYEKHVEIMESCPNRENLIHNINFLKKYLEIIKEDVKIEIDIICHG